METILKVTRDGNKINFDTDFDPMKDKDAILELVNQIAFTMVTSLWGGNESAVLAVIRSLAIADLGVSDNREKMVAFLNEASAHLEKSMLETREQMMKDGIAVQVFAPGDPRPDAIN